jgi:Na+-driven multidrug efflux pump
VAAKAAIKPDMPAVSLSYPTFAQARRIGALAIPLSAVQLAQVAISTKDTIMLSWLGGTAAGALGMGAGLAAAATGMVLLLKRGVAPAAVAEPAR